MEINIEDITRGRLDGQIVFICDYRLNDDAMNKPIRTQPPIPVMVMSNTSLPKNKKIYYSDSHFVKLKKDGLLSATVIPVYDNTGYRTYTGVPLRVFDNLDECINVYNDLLSIATDRLVGYRENIIISIDSRIEQLMSLRVIVCGGDL